MVGLVAALHIATISRAGMVVLVVARTDTIYRTTQGIRLVAAEDQTAETEGPITMVHMPVVSVREQPPVRSATPTANYTQAVVPAGLAVVTVTMPDSTIWQPRKLAVLVAVAMAAEDCPEILWVLRLEQLVMEVAVAVLFVKPTEPVVLVAVA